MICIIKAGCNSIVADLMDETNFTIYHATKLVRELLKIGHHHEREVTHVPTTLPLWALIILGGGELIN